MINNLKFQNSIFIHYYHDIVCEDLLLKENLTNVHEVPKIETIALSNSFRRAAKNAHFLIPILAGIHLFCGQKPQITKVKKSIAGFKIRENQTIGCKVTLRKRILFSFLEKLIYVVLPRTELGQSPSAFHSHFNFGLNQILLFPELENYYEFFEYFQGFNIHINMSKTTSFLSCKVLLSAFKIPLS